MQRISTTVVAAVGASARTAVERLGQAANVRTVLPASDAPPLERAVEAWQGATEVHAPYALHDADPLQLVADAWVRLYEGSGPRGELEVALSQTLARWRTGRLELPDFYLVVDAEQLPTTRRHWYLGLLRSRAPARVLATAGSPEALREALASHRAGPWWPEMDALLRDVDRVLPEQVGLGGAEALGTPLSGV